MRLIVMPLCGVRPASVTKGASSQFNTEVNLNQRLSVKIDRISRNTSEFALFLDTT